MRTVTFCHSVVWVDTGGPRGMCVYPGVCMASLHVWRGSFVPVGWELHKAQCLHHNAPQYEEFLFSD